MRCQESIELQAQGHWGALCQPEVLTRSQSIGWKRQSPCSSVERIAALLHSPACKINELPLSVPPLGRRFPREVPSPLTRDWIGKNRQACAAAKKVSDSCGAIKNGQENGIGMGASEFIGRFQHNGISPRSPFGTVDYNKLINAARTPEVFQPDRAR